MAFSTFGAMGPSCHGLFRRCVSNHKAAKINDPDSWTAPNHHRRIMQEVSCAFWSAQMRSYRDQRYDFLHPDLPPRGARGARR